MNNNSKMARKHLDAKFSEIKNLNVFVRPQKGWIKAIRNALGMTTAQLAKRLNIAQPRIVAIEKDEVLGNLKLNTIESVAEALGCRFVYALVPKQKLESMVHEQAKKKAMTLLNVAEHTMRLENQASGSNTYSEVKTLVNELLSGSTARLWDEE
ncbi:MAG TPA: mobile mystery protein A [Cyanobacteria bacterium UBA9971]|nr:mobile mystery protein A [Cyanobacteria bacterium UBA9971]